MLENRAFRIALIVIFVILLFYNVLYFTGYLGGDDVAQVQQVQEPMLDVPGLLVAEEREPLVSHDVGQGLAAPQQGQSAVALEQLEVAHGLRADAVQTLAQGGGSVAHGQQNGDCGSSRHGRGAGADHESPPGS